MKNSKKIDRYALSYNGKSRQSLLALAKEWAKPLGYIDFDGSLEEQAPENSVFNAEFKNYNKNTVRYSSHGGAKVSTQSLYNFYRFCVEIESYLPEFLDLGYKLCSCGHPQYVPDFPAEDITCDICSRKLKKACDLKSTDLWKNAVAPWYNL